MSRRNDAVDAKAITPNAVRLYLVGAGGVGREALDTAAALREEVTAFLDDSAAGGWVRGLPVLAPGDAAGKGRYLIAIADPDARPRLGALLDAAGLVPHTLVHPQAVLSPHLALGPGRLVQGGACLSCDTVLGAHSQVHYNATVGHDAVLGERVTVYPGGNVSGAVLLGDGATVGSNAVLLQGLSVGEGAFIGAGAVVTRDVPPHAVVAGSPARLLASRR